MSSGRTEAEAAAPASSDKKEQGDDSSEDDKKKKSPDQLTADRSRATKKPCTPERLFGLSHNLDALGGGNNLPPPNNPVDHQATDRNDHISNNLEPSTENSASEHKQETPKSTFGVKNDVVQGSDKATPNSQTMSTTHDDKKHAKKISSQETMETLGQKPNNESGQGNDTNKSSTAENKDPAKKSGAISEPQITFEVRVFPQIIVEEENNISENKKETTEKKQLSSEKTRKDDPSSALGLLAPK
ncbi:hypothetical protein ACOSP7_007503 [Xanthoceras sorbifolium]